MLKQSLSNELIKKFNNYIKEIEKEKSEGNYQNEMTIIDNAFKDIFRLGKKFFSSFSTENLIDMAKINGNSNADKCIMMAKLLEETGFVLEKQDKVNESFYINQKSLYIFLEAFQNIRESSTLKVYLKDIKPLTENLIQYELPEKLEIRIRDYYLNQGDYSKADDMTYYILENSNYEKRLVKNSLDFYKALLEIDSSTLEKGGLSIPEIESSIKDLSCKL